MTFLIRDTLEEWTKGLDTRQSMISVFTHIRDIPYSVSAPHQGPGMDPITSAEQLLRAGRGSCGPKHYLLAEMFRRLDLNVFYATIEFSWNDPGLDYPPDLRRLSERVPLADHLACRVQTGCRWALVDATWDPPLAAGGFFINDHWDGYSGMSWAVKPFRPPHAHEVCVTGRGGCGGTGDRADTEQGEKDHWDVRDHVRYMHERVIRKSPDQMMQRAQFYRKFDEWLAFLRAQPARKSG